MSAHEQAGEVDVAGAGFIRSLMGAWDCCATCAGGVLLRHDQVVAAATRVKLAETLASEAVVEAVADVIDRRTGRHMGIESWRPTATAAMAAATKALGPLQNATEPICGPTSLAATNDAPGADNETPAGGTESA